MLGIRLLNEKTVETVVLLSQQKPNDVIEVEIELDECGLCMKVTLKTILPL